MSRLAVVRSHLIAALEQVDAELAAVPAVTVSPTPAPDLTVPPLGGVVSGPTVTQDLPADVPPAPAEPAPPPLPSDTFDTPASFADPFSTPPAPANDPASPPVDTLPPAAPPIAEPIAAPAPILAPAAEQTEPVATTVPAVPPAEPASLILPTDPTAEKRSQLRRDVGVIEQRLLEQVGIGLGSPDASMKTAAANWQASVTAAAARLYGAIDAADAAALEAINPAAGWPQ
jgi:hypothetical protein